MKNMFLTIGALGFSGILSAAEVTVTTSTDLKTDSFIIKERCEDVDIIYTPDNVVKYYKQVTKHKYGSWHCQISVVFKGSLKGKKVTYVELDREPGHNDRGYQAEAVIDVNL